MELLHDSGRDFGPTPAALRSCFGELVQMGNSLHDWFEGRGVKAWRLSMSDDAASRPYMRFFSTDSTALRPRDGWRVVLPRLRID